MSKVYRIIARVHELRHQPGKSPCRLYKVGDEFDLSKPEEKEKICRWAYNAMFPFITILEFDGTIPWEPDSDRGYVACPDPHNIVVFELRREGILEKRETP
ncbi:MAG: TIGR04076 family protein [Candidatus Odinarchaeota archaeon]